MYPNFCYASTHMKQDDKEAQREREEHVCHRSLSPRCYPLQIGCFAVWPSSNRYEERKTPLHSTSAWLYPKDCCFFAVATMAALDLLLSALVNARIQETNPRRKKHYDTRATRCLRRCENLRVHLVFAGSYNEQAVSSDFMVVQGSEKKMNSETIAPAEA